RAPGAAARRAVRGRRAALPPSLPRPRQLGPREAAALDRAPAARRSPHLSGRRGAEERGTRGRDRRRLAPALLLAVPARGLRRLAPRRDAGLRRRRGRARER